MYTQPAMQNIFHVLAVYTPVTQLIEISNLHLFVNKSGQSFLIYLKEYTYQRVQKPFTSNLDETSWQEPRYSRYNKAPNLRRWAISLTRQVNVFKHAGLLKDPAKLNQ